MGGWPQVHWKRKPRLWSQAIKPGYYHNEVCHATICNSKVNTLTRLIDSYGRSPLWVYVESITNTKVCHHHCKLSVLVAFFSSPATSTEYNKTSTEYSNNKTFTTVTNLQAYRSADSKYIDQCTWCSDYALCIMKCWSSTRINTHRVCYDSLLVHWSV